MSNGRNPGPTPAREYVRGRTDNIRRRIIRINGATDPGYVRVMLVSPDGTRDVRVINTSRIEKG